VDYYDEKHRRGNTARFIRLQGNALTEQKSILGN
jgi:hypothetical protein